MIDRLKAAALAHPGVAWATKALASEFHHPAALIAVLTSTAEQHPEFANSRAYAEGFAALTKWQATQDLADKVSQIYWSPQLRAEFGAERVERAFADPAT